ncbi:MAG TPA: hypothetical protein VN549_02450 [Negativicutes bacterium]|nr:hypothetical protein [Negativicutes bacterium]
MWALILTAQIRQNYSLEHLAIRALYWYRSHRKEGPVRFFSNRQKASELGLDERIKAGRSGDIYCNIAVISIISLIIKDPPSQGTLRRALGRRIFLLFLV